MMGRRDPAINFSLQFPIEEIERLAAGYSYKKKDDQVIRIGNSVRCRGWGDRAEIEELVSWKSERRPDLFAQNSDLDIHEATRIALSARSEVVRLGVLQSLPGVGIPTASVILHLCHIDPYPIIDWRAFWSLGIEKMPAYSLSIWDQYVVTCRKIASDASVSMRTLDRALWQFCKSNKKL
ncbi:MAG: hypothetical protein KDA30_14205 [Phycisphaerales bacterium]|nr:hypothetical protein [Phycisphaerales bacterium]